MEDMIKRNLKINSNSFELCTGISKYLGKNIKFYTKKMCSWYTQIIKSN